MNPTGTLKPGREVYARLGLSSIPRIIGLADRNPLSPTYGCFDKNYWHYRTIDFPSGMFQECVLPLALIYKYQFPGGEEYYKKNRIRELVEAGIRQASLSSHSDGSADDYYPYERALGASCFSLYAFTEACIELEIKDEEMIQFFRRRSEWIMRHEESGRLTNHQALAALCLYNTYILTGDTRYLEGARRKIKTVLDWQHEEGWFWEYEGADPGYQTFTINYLAKYFKKSGDKSIVEPLKRAIDFSSYFMHPDGSYGGEYGSRNTYVFYPNGYEIMAPVHPPSALIADAFLRGAIEGKIAYVEDERLFFHFTGNYLEAYLNYTHEGRDRMQEPKGNFTKYFPGAGLYIRQEDEDYTVIALNKGGVVKHFKQGSHCLSDTGIAGRTTGGGIVVTHALDKYEIEVGDSKVSVSGIFSYAHNERMTTAKMLILRVVLLSIGRFYPNLIRRVLQKRLITGKKRAPIWFSRTFQFERGSLRIIDKIKYLTPGKKVKLEKLYAGVDGTSIYVVMSNQFQRSNLESWTDLSPFLDKLNKDGYVRIERNIP